MSLVLIKSSNLKLNNQIPLDYYLAFSQSSEWKINYFD